MFCIILGIGLHSLERFSVTRGRVSWELYHVVLGMFSRGARTRASLLSTTWLFLGTTEGSLLLLGTLLLFLGTMSGFSVAGGGGGVARSVCWGWGHVATSTDFREAVR